MERILLFDGVCNLCNGVVQFIIQRDPKARFKFAALQSKAGQALLVKYHLPIGDFDSFVYLSGDKLYLRSAAVLHVLKDLGGIWQLFYVLMIFPKPVRDFIYQLIAKSRYNVFGRTDSCMVPSPELKARFLEVDN
jgi:predicted DCC family thiol-disulfide oxidoreductase YuxK